MFGRWLATFFPIFSSRLVRLLSTRRFFYAAQYPRDIDESVKSRVWSCHVELVVYGSLLVVEMGN